MGVDDAVDHLFGPLLHRTLLSDIPVDAGFVEETVRSVIARPPG